MASWVTVDETRVLADMPSDLKPLYEDWLAADPSKAPRLAEIVAQTVAEFRDAIASNPANQLDPDTQKLPPSCLRSAEVIVFNTLANEMGNILYPDDSQAMTRAEIFLRQISYKNFVIDGDTKPEATPYYTVPEPELARALA